MSLDSGLGGKNKVETNSEKKNSFNVMTFLFLVLYNILYFLLYNMAIKKILKKKIEVCLFYKEKLAI